MSRYTFLATGENVPVEYQRPRKAGGRCYVVQFSDPAYCGQPCWFTAREFRAQFSRVNAAAAVSS